MANLTNGKSVSKIMRIQDEEKELLSHLRKIYANDYRKYSEHIKRESDIPLSIKKIYKLLDERKAYRRISDYFHRERKHRNTAKRRRSLHLNSHHKSYLRPLTRRVLQVPETVPIIEILDDMDDENTHDHQPSNISIIPNNVDEPMESNNMVDDHDTQRRPSALTNHSKYEQRSKASSSSSSSMNHRPQQSNNILSKPSLLIVRANMQKALRELDQAIIAKSDQPMEERDNELPRSLTNRTNFLRNGHSNLDDIVRSLSSVVNQQQENTRLIINESSALLVDDDSPLEKLGIQQSIKTILERLNSLVDRGHSIYDRVENILVEF